MTDGLHCTVADRVATITIDRPETRNSLAPEVVGRLIEMMRALDRDPAVKSILIQATGKDFTVGGDIKGFRELMSLPAEERYDTFERKMLVANRMPLALLEVAKPVVVATRGSVAGAGVAMCLAADFVVASQTSYFLLAHVLIGLSLDCGLSGLLIPAMGIKAAKRLAMLGERVTAQEALELGIVTRTVEDEALDGEAAALARRLANGPGLAIGITKSLLNHAAYGGFVEQLTREATGVARCAASGDFPEGIESILGRRPPRFA